jgi:hypothetical protein
MIEMKKNEMKLNELIGIRQLLSSIHSIVNEPKELLKKEIIKADASLIDHTYAIANENEEMYVTIEDIINNANIFELRELQKDLHLFSKINDKIVNNTLPVSNGTVDISVLHKGNKSLRIELDPFSNKRTK